MKNIIKISIFLITIVLTILFLTKEIIFLLTEMYTSSFFDLFGSINIVLIPLILVVLTIIQVLLIIKTKLTRLIVISFISILLFAFTYFVSEKLNKTNLIAYRQDLGLQAFYLYIDKESNDYILVYTYPFGKKTIIGHYTLNNSIIILDKDLKLCFELGEYFKELNSNSIDLNKMNKL